jgi:hypothetical protein
MKTAIVGDREINFPFPVANCQSRWDNIEEIPFSTVECTCYLN